MMPQFSSPQILKALVHTHTPVTVCQSESCNPVCQVSLCTVCLCACVFSKHGGCFSLAADRHRLGKACQSNTCNLLLNVKRVKYAHPPCLTAIPKPNLIIPVCASAVFINHFHHFFLNTIKWKCNQTHKLQSNLNSLQSTYFHILFPLPYSDCILTCKALLKPFSCHYLLK